MNAIMTASDSPTMSSREIAELTGKEHKHVIRDIRTMIDALGDGPNLGHVRETKDARGYTAEILLPKRESLVLVSSYNLTMRAAIIDRWQDIEAKKQHPDPIMALEMLHLLGRPALEDLISHVIDLLDEADGDPDIEEDDPSGMDDEDGCNMLVSATDADHYLLDPPVAPIYGTDQSAAPLPPDRSTDRVLMRQHRDRIRATRCRKVTYPANCWGGPSTGYRLT